MSEKDIACEEKTDVETEKTVESDEVLSTESVQSDEQEKTEKTEKTALYYASLGALVALFALFVIMLTTVLLFPKNETVEAGSLPNYSYITENRFWGNLCEVVTDVRSIDTSKVGEQTVMLRFFGFIDVKSKLTVVNTFSPDTAQQETTNVTDTPIESEPISDTTDIDSSIDEVEPSTETASTETDIIESEPLETAPPEELPNEEVVLDVENILQNPSLPNGCEVVSLAIALGYMGYEVEPGWLFDNYMPHSLYDFSGDPMTTYIGNPRAYGLGCYAPCVVTTGNEYLADMESSLIVTDVSGMELPDYEEYIDRGIPVIMWGMLYMNGSDNVHRTWWVNGEMIRWYSNSHCLVLIGYTNHTYVFCDPLRGVVEYSRESVEKSFNINLRQACVIVEQNNALN